MTKRWGSTAVKTSDIKAGPLGCSRGWTSLGALLRGYLFFRVNGRSFLLYRAARRASDQTAGSLCFVGWHVFMGWRGFRYQFVADQIVCPPDTIRYDMTATL